MKGKIMATTNAHSSNTATKNDGGTIANAGNISSTGKSNDAGLGIVNGSRSENPPKPTTQTGTSGNFSSPGKEGRTTAKGSGTFAYDMQSGKIIAKRGTETINGVSSTSLQSGGTGKGARQNSAIHTVESYHTLPKYTTNADGSHASTVSAGGSSTSYTDSAGNGSTASSDSAANPTRAIPGELAYMETGAIPTQDDYKPET
jgi:hypothetical protein